MKKNKLILFLVFSAIFILIFTSSSQYKYQGKEVSSIEYVSIDYNGGSTRETIVDLVDCQVLHRWYIPFDNVTEEYSIDYRFEMSSVSMFLDEVGVAGLFNLKDYYPSPGGIIDGGGWTLTIHYADGSSKMSSGSNNSPSYVFKKADYAFYNLYGDDLFNSLPTSYTNPPHLSISFGYSIGNNQTGSCYVNGLPPINYTWHKSSVSDVDVVSYAIQNPIHEFDRSNNYTFGLGTKDCEHTFSNMVVTSYDINGNDPKEIAKSNWLKEIKPKSYNLDFNRVYVIKMTFPYGTCEYAFSTVDYNS